MTTSNLDNPIRWLTMMFTFFHGWRRKAGCVALVMALAMTSLWMRSFLNSDVIAFPICNRDWHICPVEGDVYWHGWSKSGDLSGIYFFHHSENVQNRREYVQQFGAVADISFSEWVIRYWSLVLPLTLLAAYLILRKSRKTTAP